jgi:membrane fusion protein (multidrug efflux system)
MDEPIPTLIPAARRLPSRHLGLRCLVTAGFCLFIGTILLAGSGRAQDSQDEKKSAPRGIPVESIKAEVRSISQKIRAVGTLTSNESVVVTAEIAARVTEIDFAEGRKAGAGQILARLDGSTLTAQRDRARASLNLSQANRERAEILFQEEAISQRERDEAVAQWKLDEASLRLAQAQLEKTVLKAPFDGVLGLRHVSVGEYVQPGQAIVTLDDTDPIKVDFRVPEVYSPDLYTGQTVQVSIDAAPGRTFNGEVYAIEPTVDPVSRSLKIRAKIPNRQGVLRSGMFARIQLVLEEKPQAIMIPEEALLSRGEERFVYRVVDGKVTEAIVRTGLRQPGMVEIVEGLSPGDTVITAGQIKVRPGMPVTLLPASGGN